MYCFPFWGSNAIILIVNLFLREANTGDRQCIGFQGLACQVRHATRLPVLAKGGEWFVHKNTCARFQARYFKVAEGG